MVFAVSERSSLGKFSDSYATHQMSWPGPEIARQKPVFTIIAMTSADNAIGM